jgi:hypothetical protein
MRSRDATNTSDLPSPAPAQAQSECHEQGLLPSRMYGFVYSIDPKGAIVTSAHSFRWQRRCVVLSLLFLLTLPSPFLLSNTQSYFILRPQAWLVWLGYPRYVYTRVYGLLMIVRMNRPQLPQDRTAELARSASQRVIWALYRWPQIQRSA